MATWEFWLNVLLLLALGVLGASSVIIKKKPEARDLIDKIAKFSGTIGIIGALWGIWDLIGALRWIRLVSLVPLIWISWLVTALVFIALGFIFGYGMVASYMSAEAKSKAEQIRQKLIVYQIPLGYVSLAMAVWWIILNYVIY